MDLATDVYFLVFQEIGEVPKKMRYLEVERAVVLQLARSASQ